MAHARKYSKELLDRGAWLVFESGRPVAHVARDLAIETLRKHVRQTEADERGRKDVLSSQEREEIKALRREVAQLRRANETDGRRADPRCSRCLRPRLEPVPPDHLYARRKVEGG